MLRRAAFLSFFSSEMVKIEVVLHPRGLHPTEAARAYNMRFRDHMVWKDIAADTVNLQGDTPSVKCVRLAVARVHAQRKALIPVLGYHNCGRHKDLTAQQEKDIVSFVKKWRHKRFCTCPYIKQHLRLKVSARTVQRTLKRHGFRWRAVPKKIPLTPEQLKKRETFVGTYGDKSAAWWEANLNLVLDGVTLTKAPQGLRGRQLHAVQSIDHLWVREGETLHSDVHTYNRYGVQLGTKVPLWGGFTGGGKFVLRLWTPQPKMRKEDWAAYVPQLKSAIDAAEAAAPERATKKAKVWQDNERFIKLPLEYKRSGLQLVNFPPNSGDLNPIETVWAALRKALAVREQEDLQKRKIITVPQFRARVAQILNSFSEVRDGEKYSFLQKLVRGMPKRLARCKANSYGRCGK